MNWVKNFLSGKTAGILALLIAAIAINCWELVLDNFRSDDAFIIAAARNLAAGHGYSIRMAPVHDLSAFYYAPLNKWPPGYSWLLWLVHAFSGTDWLHAAYLLNGFALCAIVIVFWILLFQLNIPRWFIPLAMIYFGFIPHAFLSSYADIPGLLSYLTGLCLLMRYLRSEKEKAWIVLLAALAFSFAVYFKYLYLAIAFVPHLCLFLYGIQLKRKDLRKSALKGIAVLFLFLSILFLYLYLYSGKAYYFYPTGTGFYPEQLIRKITAIPASFMNLNFYNLQVSLHSHISYEDMGLFWATLNGICLIGLLYICLNFFKRKIYLQEGRRTFYIIQAFFVSVILFLFLAILSVRLNKYYSLIRQDWVYLEETRYYAIFSIFLLQFSVYLFLSGKRFLSNKGIVIYRVLMILVMLGEILHGSYYFIKKIGIEREYGVRRKTEKIDLLGLSLTKRELLKTRNVVICSNSAEIRNVCGFSDAATFDDIRLLPAYIPTSAPVVLVTIIDTNIPYLFPPYFRTNETKLEYVYSGVYYYTTKIPKTTGN
jgi:hypothetical protein